MSYDKRIDSRYPGCILFLLDQSWSMSGAVVGGKQSKAAALADAINSTLYELSIRSSPRGSPKHYYDVGAIGYGSTVGPAFPGDRFAGRTLVSIEELMDHPLRMDERRQPDGNVVKEPVWVDPVAPKEALTPMGAALKLAASTVKEWTHKNQESFPPIVINISDGAATDGDPRKVASELRELRTNDGNVLLLNLNVSGSKGDTMFCPANDKKLPDDYARVLYDMSSRLPGPMLQSGIELGYRLEAGAHGFVFNGDVAALTAFLKIGTMTTFARE